MSRQSVTCAAPKCRTIVEAGKLMCKGHWFSVPKPLRDDVWRTWREAQKNWRGKTGQEEQLRRIRAYREAVRTAVDAIEGVPPTPASAMATTANREDGQAVAFESGELLCRFPPAGRVRRTYTSNNT